MRAALAFAFALALTFALVLLGCATSPARTRILPLDVPPVRDLALNATDLPPSYHESDSLAMPRSLQWTGYLDGFSRSFIRNASDDARAEIHSTAFTFETPADAHAQFVDLSTAPHSVNVTDEPWGDEARVVIANNASGSLVLRNGTVTWLVAFVHAPDQEPDVAPDALAARLLAKLQLHPAAAAPKA